MLTGALRLPKERGTGDVAPQRGRRERKHLSIGHRLFAPATREIKEAGGGPNFQAAFRRGQAWRVNRPRRSTPSDRLSQGVQRRSVFGAHGNLQSIRILNRSDAIDSDLSLDARGSCVLAIVDGPGRGQSDPSSGSRARTCRPHEEHGSILCPVDRTDALRGSGACAALGSHRERGASADRPAPVPAGRADRAREMARSEAASRIPAPGLISGDRLQDADTFPGGGAPHARAKAHIAPSRPG